MARTKTDCWTWPLGMLGLGGASLAAALLGAYRPVPRTALIAFADARGGLALKVPYIAQEDAGDAEDEVTPDQVEKYIAVYKAMQRDHTLEVGQAAAQQGLSLDTFRDIERRIERDDMIRERVRQALRAVPEESASAPTATPPPRPTK